MSRSLPSLLSTSRAGLSAALLTALFAFSPVSALAQDDPRAEESAGQTSESSTAEPEGTGVAGLELIDEGLSLRLDEWVRDTVPPLANEVLGNAAWRYLAVAVTILLFLLLRSLLSSVVVRWVARLTKHTKTDLDDRLLKALTPPLRFFILLLGIVAGFSWLSLPQWADDALGTIWRLGFVITLVWVALGSVGLVVSVLANLAGSTKSDLDDRLVPLVARIIRVVIIGLGAVFVLEEMGFNVGAMLAGLGVGGLALALAAQDTMANWFGALMIYTDKPFQVGDWIKTSNIEGVVEDIGLRSTKVRTFGKTLISVPNRDLAASHIENFSERPLRRVTFDVGLTYDTTPHMMREAVARMRDILRNHSDVDQAFWLVKFTGFGDSALNVMLYFFTLTTDWNRYLDIREEINLEIMETLREIGVGMAFPSTSVYLEKPDAEEIAKLDAQARELFAARVKAVDKREKMTAPSMEAADG